MPEPEPIPKLLRLLYPQNPPAVECASPKLLQWAAAFEDWLDKIEQSRGRASRRNSRSAWRDFLAFFQGLPWNVRLADVERWRDELQKGGKAPLTINHKLSALRAFYQHVHNSAIEPQLPPVDNPALVSSLPVSPIYHAFTYLSCAEAQALLAAVDRDRSLIAKRDYAMLLLALCTALESGQIRLIRWSDLVFDSQPVQVQCRNASRRFTVSIPADAWSAVQDYLQATGRLSSMTSEMYLFAPLADPLRLAPSGQAAEWAADRPISPHLMSHLLCQYAAWANLDEKQVTWHCLRHTAAVFRLEAGDDIEEILYFQGRTNRVKLLAFLKEYRERPKEPLWRSLPEAPAPRESTPGESITDPSPSDQALGPHRFAAGRRARGAQPGCQNGIKTGFYSRQRRPKDPSASPLSPALRMRQMEMNVQNILDRALSLVDGTQSMDEMLRLADIYSRTTGRLVSIFKAQGGIKSLSAAVRDCIDRAIARVLMDVSRQVADGTFPCQNPRLGPKDDELIAAFVRLVRLILDNPDKVDEMYHNEP